MSLRIVRPGLVARVALLLGALSAAAVTVASEPTAHAQQTPSASDISAARALFAQGVKLQESGKPAEALELFRRADHVYAAPTIQLHLAECQAAVGQLVESAETYRRLNNTNLPADASVPFRAAQTQGQTELPQVEARIPQLRVDVVPPNTDGVEVQIDGVPLNAALVGVSRPINPGEHKIVASAPGFASAGQTVTVPERRRDGTVTLTLTPLAGRADTTGAIPPPPPPMEVDGAAAESNANSRYGFLLGARGGVNILAGSLDGPTSISKNLGVGGSFGIEGGFRLARRLYLGATFEYVSYSGGDIDSSVYPTGDSISQSAHSEYFGVDVGYMSNPTGTLGFYGELGAGYRVLSYAANDTDTRIADNFEFGGGEGQIGLGATLRIGKYILLIPKVDLNVGTFSVNSNTCSLAYGCRTIANQTTADPVHEAVLFALGAYFDKDL